MSTLLPSRLAAGEDYASVSDILEVQDLAEATIHVPFWQRNGKPLALKVRGLSLDAQEQVRMQAARKVAKADRAHGAKQHWPTFCAMTLCFGCLQPAFTPEQALALFRKNAAAVELVSQFIWTISAVSQDTIDSIVETMTRAEALATGEDEEPTQELDGEEPEADSDADHTPES